MDRTIDVTLLGGFDVRIGDRVVREQDWDRRRPLELAQLLALAPGQHLVRDKVIDALWPELDLSAGAANLRKTAHRARQALDSDDAVVLRAGHVHLFPDDRVTTDLDRFHADAAAALAAGDPDRCAAVAAEVPGPLLPGSPYDPWTEAPRRHARQTHLALLRTAGRWEDVVHLDPTDEAAYQALIRTAIEQGTRAAAVRWFAAARSALTTELGVGPSEETRALYQEAVDGLTDAPAVLVGREVELAEARAHLRRAATDGVGLVAVRGGPGIGKSAFCREVVAAAASDGWATSWTDTVGTDRPYGPLTALAEQLVLADPEVWTALGDHDRGVLAVLSDILPAAPPPTGPLTRHQVVGVVTRLLRISGGGGPVLLVVDDAHEADRATVGVVFQLATSVPDVAVVLSMRPGPIPAEVRDGMSRLDRTGRLGVIELGPLDDGSASTLVRRSAARCVEDPEVDRLVRLGRGNPFALTELARSHDDAGGHLPRSVAEAITSRLVGLDPDRTSLLRRLSVASDDLDSDTVVALTGATEAEAFDVLDRALDAGVLVVSGARYRFRHGLVRDALVAQVAPHRRRAVHRDAARRLSRAGAPAAAVAAQWLQAGEPAEAATWCLQAAATAMEVGAFVDARRHLAPVLAHAPTGYAALRMEAECLDMLGDPAALAAYDAAIAQAPAEEADDLVVGRGLAQIKQGDPAGGLASIRGARPRSTMGRINEALTYAGAAALGATDPLLGTEKAAEVRRIALQAGDRAGLTIASWAHAAAAHARGELHDVVLTDLRETTDLPDLAVRVFDGHLCMTQRFLYGSKPYAEVIRFADDLTEEADRLGAARGRAFGRTLRGEALMLSGRVDEAWTELTSALDLHRQTAGTTGEAHAVIRLAETAHHQGRQHDARALLDTALDLTRSSDVGFHLLDRMFGVRIGLTVDPDEALARVEEAEDAVRGPLETCPGCRIHLTVPAAIAAARAGDLERARTYAEAVAYLADVVMRLPAWYAAHDEVRGHLARAGGDGDDAGGYFLRAADRFTEAGQPLDARRCRDLADHHSG